MLAADIWENWTALAIAGAYELDMETAFDILDERSQKFSQYRTILTFKLRNEFNLSFKDIAYLLNFSDKSAPYYLLKRNNIEDVKRQYYIQQTVLNKDDRGYDAETISNELKISVGWVNGIIRRYGREDKIAGGVKCTDDTYQKS